MDEGPFMFVHEVTGTYLETDNYNDNIGTAVQTWNEDPLKTAKGQLGHLWYTEATSNGGYLIKSYENSRCLTASAAKASDYPRLQDYDKDDPKQRWSLRQGLYGETSDDYAIIPELYPGYALSVQGDFVRNNVYVVPVRMWGDTPSLVHFWKRVPATT
ncbi:MAG: RICIN domain-containing protein [Pseudonocardiaceae bacterium]